MNPNRTLAAALCIGLLATAITPASAGTLPGGTALEIQLTGPGEGEQYLVPPGHTIGVPVTGTTWLAGEPEPGPAVILVMDLSPHADYVAGDCGDANGDGASSTALDCQVDAAVAVAAALDGATPIGIIGYGRVARSADHDPGYSFARLAAAGQDGDGDAEGDVVEVSRSLRTGSIGLFTFQRVRSESNYEAALAQARLVADEATAGGHEVLVVMLSAGAPTSGSDRGARGHASYLGSIPGLQFHGFALGALSCEDAGGRLTLEEASAAAGGSCHSVPDGSDLASAVSGLLGGQLTDIAVHMDGGAPASLDPAALDTPLPAPAGTTVGFATTVDVGGAGDHEICVTAWGSDSGGPGAATVCRTVTVLEALEGHADVKPGACPNNLNGRSRGVTPVALVGTEDVPADSVDPSSLLVNGIVPDRVHRADVATPYEGDLVDAASCHELEGDGTPDLLLHVDTQVLADALGAPDGPGPALVHVTGHLADGTPFEAFDVAQVKRPGKA